MLLHTTGQNAFCKLYEILVKILGDIAPRNVMDRQTDMACL